MPRAVACDAIYRRRRYTPEVIELCVRWYLTYRLARPVTRPRRASSHSVL